MTAPAELRAAIDRAAASARWAAWAYVPLLLAFMVTEAMRSPGDTHPILLVAGLALFVLPLATLFVLAVLIRAGNRDAADLTTVLAVLSTGWGISLAVLFNLAARIEDAADLGSLLFGNVIAISIVWTSVRLVVRSIRASRAMRRLEEDGPEEQHGFEPILPAPAFGVDASEARSPRKPASARVIDSASIEPPVNEEP